MLWWLPPLTNAGYVVQAIAGAIVGIVWYAGMRIWRACSLIPCHPTREH